MSFKRNREIFLHNSEQPGKLKLWLVKKKVIQYNIAPELMMLVTLPLFRKNMVVMEK